MSVEIALAVLIAALGAASIFAAYVGLLGIAGAKPLHRCARCHHLCLTSRMNDDNDCGYCRHDRLLHPMWALRHSDTSFWSAHHH